MRIPDKKEKANEDTSTACKLSTVQASRAHQSRAPLEMVPCFRNESFHSVVRRLRPAVASLKNHSVPERAAVKSNKSRQKARQIQVPQLTI